MIYGIDPDPLVVLAGEVRCPEGHRVARLSVDDPVAWVANQLSCRDACECEETV